MPERVVAPATKARIVAAIQAWASVTGRAPGAMDWNRSSATHRPTAATAYRSWPAVSSVVSAFGTWNTAIQEAGFEPLKRGYRRDPDAWRRSLLARDPRRSVLVNARRNEVARMWTDGLTGSQIAAQLGVTRKVIYDDVHRLRAQGVPLAGSKGRNAGKNHAS